MKRILTIDDDVEQCNLLQEFLRREDFDCECAYTGDEGLKMLKEGAFDLVILDVMLPGKDGFTVLREIRKGSEIPVMMLTARGEPIDRVIGLELGADDYIGKPFTPQELSARIRAILRRFDVGYRNGTENGEAGSVETVLIDTPPATLTSVLRDGDLTMDLLSRTVSIDGREIPLTNIEFKILELLLANIGRTVPVQTVAAKTQKRSHSLGDRSLSVHLSNLRRKLGPHSTGNERVATIRGQGFVYVRARQPQEEG